MGCECLKRTARECAIVFYYSKLFFVWMKRKLKRTCLVIGNVGLKGIVQHAVMLGSKKSHNPLRKTDVVLLSLPKHGQHSLPMGLGYLKASLSRNGIGSYCFDFNHELYLDQPGIFDSGKNYFVDEEAYRSLLDSGFSQVLDSWARRIMKLNPKIIGISLTSDLVYFALGSILKRLPPGPKIVLGGPRCMIDGKSLIESGYGDIAVLGQGEEVFSQLVQKILRNESIRDVPNIIYKGKKTIKTKSRVIKTALDDIPIPDFRDFRVGTYSQGISLPVIPVSSSRGCKNRCRFCNIGFLWNNYQGRTAASVFREMHLQKKRHNTNNFTFNDTMINSDYIELSNLCRLIIRSKQIFTWSANYAINKPMPYSFYRMLATAGCNSLCIGLESGSEKVRRHMGKLAGNMIIMNQINHMHKAGIDVRLQVIIGYPTETESDFRETLIFIKRVSGLIDSVRFGGTCLLMEGSWLTRNASKLGISYDEEGNWYTGDNNISLRLDRLKRANRFGQRLGLVRESDAHDPTVNRKILLR